MKIKTVLFISSIIMLSMLFGVSQPAKASDHAVKCPICSRANDPSAPYAEKAGATFIRGVLNTAFGWTELLVKPVDEIESGRNIRNVIRGIGNGVGSSITRTGAGIGELFTFWLPKGKKDSPPLITTCPLSRSRSQADAVSVMGSRVNLGGDTNEKGK